VAGNGDSEPWADQTPLRDGGLATEERISQPAGVAADPAGRVYVSDYWDDRVRRVDPAGIISTVAGGGSAFPGDGGVATDAVLREPSGLAADGAGNLYIADVGHDLIRKVSPEGVISTVAGGGNPPIGTRDVGDHRPAREAKLGLSSSSTLAFDALGQLHLTGGSRVRKVDLAGTITTAVGGGQTLSWYPDGQLATQIGLGDPTGIAFDANGSLYIADSDQKAIRMIDTMGRVRTVAGTNDIHTGLGDGGPATEACIDLAYSGTAFDAGGNLYVTDSHNHRIRRIETPFTPTRVLAAGWNGVGQLGDATTTDRHTLVRAGALANVTAVGAGYCHSLAVRADGTVWAWGWNYFGQLGDGTTTDRRGPVQVQGLDHVVAVAGGAYHSLALRADGTVWAWGWNGVGQLGDGTTTDRRLPVQVLRVANVREIAAGMLHNLAVTHDGAVRAWGWNKFGQLGTGSLSQLEATPVPVPGANGAVSVAAGAASGWKRLWNAR